MRYSPGKTRMRDFTQYEVDTTIVSEVNKCIESYLKRGAIPTAVLEVRQIRASVLNISEAHTFYSLFT